MTISNIDKARLNLFALIPHCAPQFKPKPWHIIQSHTEENTCYAYAMNDGEIGRVPVGHSADAGINCDQSFSKMNKKSKKSLRQIVEGDGAIYAGKKKPDTKPGCYIVAAFTGVMPFCIGSHRIRGLPIGKHERQHERTYHFYRLDNSGTWSHKVGSFNPTDRNPNHTKISAPRSHARKYGDYDDMQFVGYFYVPNSGLPLGSREKIHPFKSSVKSRRQRKLAQADTPMIKMYQVKLLSK